MNNNLLRILILFSGVFLSQKNETKKDLKKQLPNFKDILEVKHSIKGRIRLKCNELIDNEEGKDALISTFSQIPSIKEISVNTHIGTIIIKYDEDEVQAILIIGIILRVLGLEEEVQRKTKSILTKESANILESISYTIYEKTYGILDLKSSVMILIGSYALYDIKTRPGVRPSGITCLWWLYSLATRPN